MSFWNDASTLSPKQAHRWVIYLGDNRTTALYFKSVDKPSFAIKNIKTKYLYSHEFNFPGRVSWQPITLVLNDLIIYNDKKDFTVDWHLAGNGPVGTNKKINQSTQSFIYGLLNKAGYYGPNEAAQTTYESNVYLRGFNFKKDLIRELVGSSSCLEIQELDNEIGVPPGGNSVEIKPFGVQGERWKLFNPLISDVKFEKLDYSVDNALSITLTLNYDWAELHGPEGATAAAPSAPTVAPPPASKPEENVNPPKVEVRASQPVASAPPTPPAVDANTVGATVGPAPTVAPSAAPAPPAAETPPVGSPTTADSPPEPPPATVVAAPAAAPVTQPAPAPVVDTAPAGTSSTTTTQPSDAPSLNVAPPGDATSPAPPAPAAVADTPPVGQPAVDKSTESAPAVKTATVGESSIGKQAVSINNVVLGTALSTLKPDTTSDDSLGFASRDTQATAPSIETKDLFPKPESVGKIVILKEEDTQPQEETVKIPEVPVDQIKTADPAPPTTTAVPSVTDFSSAADPQLAQRAQQYIRDPSATLEQKTAIAGTLASRGVLLDLAGTGLENKANTAALKELSDFAKTNPQAAAIAGADFQKLISADNPVFAKPAEQERPVAAIAAPVAPPPPPPIETPQAPTPQATPDQLDTRFRGIKESNSYKPPEAVWYSPETWVNNSQPPPTVDMFDKGVVKDQTYYYITINESRFTDLNLKRDKEQQSAMLELLRYSTNTPTGPVKGNIYGFTPEDTVKQSGRVTYKIPISTVIVR